MALDRPIWLALNGRWWKYPGRGSSEHVGSYHSGESPEGCFTQGSWVQSEAVVLVALLCQGREGIDCIDCFVCLLVSLSPSSLTSPHHIHTLPWAAPLRDKLSKDRKPISTCARETEKQRGWHSQMRQTCSVWEGETPAEPPAQLGRPRGSSALSRRALSPRLL